MMPNGAGAPAPASGAESAPPPLRPVNIPTSFENKQHLPWRISGPKGDVWHCRRHPELKGDIGCDWGNLRRVSYEHAEGGAVLSDRAIDLLKAWAAERAPHMATRSLTHGLFWFGLEFARWLARSSGWAPVGRPFEWGDLTKAMFRAFRDSYRVDGRSEQAPNGIRDFYRWLTDPARGAGDGALTILAGIERVRCRGTTTGLAVRELDPYDGPFLAEELSRIDAALLAPPPNLVAADPAAYTRWQQDRAITWIFRDTGQRPSQIAALKQGDLCRIDLGTTASGDGASLFHVRMPQMKGSAVTAKRAAVGVSSECGALLEEVTGMPDPDPQSPLLWWLGAAYVDALNGAMQRFFAAADLRSPRLPIADPLPGAPQFARMPVFAYRFRYARTKDMLDNGVAPDVVSAVLGHMGAASWHAYHSLDASVADRVQAATDHVLLPLVKRMRHGRVEDPRAPLPFPEIPPILPPQLTGGRELVVLGGSIGKCALGLKCPKSPVLACFPCDDFIPRPDRVPAIRETRGAMAAAAAARAPHMSPQVLRTVLHALASADEWIAFLAGAAKRARPERPTA